MKDYRISLLADYYGEMLTPRSLDMLRKYYDEDLSLAEIAEGWDVTRQAVSEAVNKAAQSLEEYESNLGLIANHDKLFVAIDAVIATCTTGNTADAIAQLTEIKKQI